MKLPGNLKINLGHMFLILILVIIMMIHVEWCMSHYQSRMLLYIILISYLIFFLIFAEHVYYVEHVNENENYEISEKNLFKLKQNNINFDNNVFRLIINIGKYHPIFASK